MATETDIAYLAGIVDGEGCIRVKKSQAYRCQDRVTPGYHACIQVRMVNEEAIKFLAETLGGWYYREKPHSTKGRPLFCWQVTDKKAAEALTTLLPYLRVKRPVAETVLELRALQADGAKHRTKATGSRPFPNKYGTVRTIETRTFSDEYVAMCEALFLRSKELNQVGVA